MDTPTGTLAWGILAPGRIAKAFASALATTTTGRLVAMPHPFDAQWAIRTASGSRATKAASGSRATRAA